MNDQPSPSDEKKHVLFSLKIAGFLIGASLLLTLGLNKGLIRHMTIERAFGVLLGLSLAVYGNAIPKFTGASQASTRDAKSSQTMRRVSGWALTVGFLLSAALWGFASDNVARIGSIACPGLSAVVILAFVIRNYIQCRKSRARDISKSVLFLVLVPLSSLYGQEIGLEFPDATPESQGVSRVALQQVADEVHEYVRNGTVIGAELLIIKNRKTILHEVYGDRDRESKQPMERNSIFNIRSMTKPLTGVAIQLLVDEGKVKLDDTVAQYLQGFDNEKSSGITIEQLLQHRSGLPLTILSLRLDEFANLQDQANAISEKGPEFPPGEKFWYSDAGSDAAAALVEKVSGQPIDRFISERILRPLRMDDSVYLHHGTEVNHLQRSRVCSLYVGRPGFWFRFWSPSDQPFYPFAWGSQSLYSTPMDYARFLALWMDGGRVEDQRILSEGAMGRVLTPVSVMKQLGSDKPYPCGFFGMHPHYGQMSMLYAPGENPSRSDVVGFGHDGSDGTGAWAFPKEDLIVCYFTQSRGQSSTIRLQTTIQDALLHHGGDTAIPDDLKPLIGTYYGTIGPYKDAPFQIAYRCGKLAFDIPGELLYELMEPDADGRRALRANPTNAITFNRDRDGRVVSMALHKPKGSFEMTRGKRADEGDSAK